ncbi:MAG: nitronate monooxygenase [Thermoleophilia bacterium]
MSALARRRSWLRDRLGVRVPLVQAPMAGGPTTVDLVAAVAEAGALGSLAAALLPPERIVEDAAAIRARTDRPFAINLFVLGHPTIDEAAVARSLELLAPVREELGLVPGVLPERVQEPFDGQLAALLEAAPAVVSFTFGILDADEVEELKEAGCVVVGTATTPDEAIAWEGVGADAVVAQGAEAGAHRGTFLAPVERSLVGLAALVPRIVDVVRIPVLAAGGIMDGRGVAAALALGADAAVLGTAFLGCPEAGVSDTWRASLRAATGEDTTLTRGFTGRHARAIRNDLLELLAPHEADLPAYPVQGALTADIRRAAAAAGRREYVNLWAGQGVGMLRELPAAELVRVLVDETDAAIRALAGPV